MPVFEVDGLPYIDAAWLERRIYRDFSRMQVWQQQAHRFVQRSDAAGRETCRAYMTQALHMSYRVEKWRRCLVLTQSVIVGVQSDTRLGFGQLVRERRKAAGLTLLALAQFAGLDDKTIKNVEAARFFVSRKTIAALLAVPALGLSWADVGQELLEENPADGRKHRKPRQAAPTEQKPKRKRRSRLQRRNRRFRR
ncbi:helix-turn-helix domain-containing protein [Haliangium sp. UPWRP_2]|uniref:helix-turn-helix domain-containing protein n=1 Tax=Haliangium sp. UPWRP_2 TaxID=1931276 RepID=UPI001304C5F2|nr:helix-turn-helix domain-containing protein [Haliangium sp. UPWRP_2]